MQRNYVFSKHEFMTAHQINGFWSRESSRLRREPDTSYNDEDLEQECRNDFSVFQYPAIFDSPNLDFESEIPNRDCFENI